MVVLMTIMILTLSVASSAVYVFDVTASANSGWANEMGDDAAAAVSTSVSGTSYSSGDGNYTYSWTYESIEYTISFDISDPLYESYVSDTIERFMTTDEDVANALNFITTDDVVIEYISACMDDLSVQSGLDQAEEAQMVLNFVQEAIPYSYDTDTHSMTDYWSFPVETLHDGSGDCEDKSFLYASIMERIGYGSALIMYDEHVAVGVNCTGLSGWYYDVDGLRYYYCETTSTGWTIGEMPSGYNKANVMVIDGRPSAPVELDADPGYCEVTLTWEAPLSDGGYGIDHYVIYQDGTEVGNTTELTFTVTGLVNGRMYHFTVAANNSEGTGDQSDRVSAIPSAISVPDAPEDLTVTAGDGSATIEWSAPDDDGGAEIDYYIIYVDGTPVARAYGTSTELTGLTNGVNYSVYVAAHNSAGVGDGTEAASVTPSASTDDGSEWMLVVVIVTMTSMAILVLAVYLSERDRRKRIRTQDESQRSVPSHSGLTDRTQQAPYSNVPSPAPTALGPRFCSQCGSPLEANASYCSACGNRVR